MSVFKEGFEALYELSGVEAVFKDACDAGLPVNKGDKRWNAIKALKWYHMDSDKSFKNEDGTYGWFEVELINEGLVSDGELTVEEATVKIRVEYHVNTGYNKFNMNEQFKNADGWVLVTSGS